VTSSLACSALASLGLLCGCSVAEVWMGQRCASARRCGAHDAAVRDAEPLEDDSYEDAGRDGGMRRCVAGLYTGSFEMTYRSGPAGVCGVIAQLQTDRAFGGWSFALSERLGDAGTSYLLDDGCLRAGGEGPSAADGGSKTPPLRALLSGSVDCTTGELRGELRGTYAAVSVCDFGVVLQDYYFKGSMSGTFDPATRTFVNGEVRWQEPPVLIPPTPGGEGTWTAALTRDDEVDAGNGRDCLNGVRFRDELFPDASTP
jgi:hypothetical protein